MKGFRQNILDFEIISTGNPKTFVFLDSSDYIDESPDQPLLEVTFPGYNKYFIVNVKARAVNTFNSNTLGLTELLNSDCLVDLPDGLYKLKYKICPYNNNFKNKSIFRTTLLEEKLKSIYLDIDASDCNRQEDKQLMRDVSEVYMLIEGAKAIADKDAKKAISFYKLASSLVDLINSRSKCCN